MAETTPGLGDLLNLLGAANPLSALTKNIDNLKKGVEGFIAAVQTFTRTMEALEETTKRITSLMDDVEAPVRAVLEQLAALPANAFPQAIANLNTLSTNLTQLLTPLGSVAGLAGSFFSGLRPSAATPPETPAPAPSAPEKQSARAPAKKPARTRAPRSRKAD